jgi:F0F1-type ATP synthase delta subunit
MNDMKFKDIFDKRDNIKQFLEEQFTNQKDKVKLYFYIFSKIISFSTRKFP